MFNKIYISPFQKKPFAVKSRREAAAKGFFLFRFCILYSYLPFKGLFQRQDAADSAGIAAQPFGDLDDQLPAGLPAGVDVEAVLLVPAPEPRHSQCAAAA